MFIVASLFAFASPSSASPPPPAEAVAVEQDNMRRDRGDRSRRGDQDFASRAVRAGEIRSLSEIEARIVPRMRGARYLGSTFDRDTAVYTLKFMGEAAVIWVEVDGRSGRVIR